MKINPISTLKPVQYKHNDRIKDKTFENEYIETKYTNAAYTNPVAFGQKKKGLDDYIKLRKIKKNFTPETEALYDKAHLIARKTGSAEIESWHFYLASLYAAKSYIKNLNAGTMKHDEQSRLKLPFEMQKMVSLNELPMFSDESLREKAEKVIDEHIKQVKKDFIKQGDKSRFLKIPNPTPSKSAIGDMVETYDILANILNTDTFYDSYFFSTAFYSQDKKLVKEANRFVFDLQKAVMVDDSDKKKKNHLQFYDEKADTIWKNISIGNDAVFVYDSSNTESPKHLISSFLNIINKPDKKYKNLNPEDVEIVLLKENATFELLNSLVKEAKTSPDKKDKTTVIVGSLLHLIKNSPQGLTLEDLDTLKNDDKKNKNGSNVRLVFSINRESYYANMEKNKPLYSLMGNYAVQGLPVINMVDAMKNLTNENGMHFVESEVKTTVSADTIKKAIELTSTEDGNYPDKVTSLLSRVKKFYVDVPDITPELLEKYILESRGLSETQGANPTTSGIVFDTGKNLSDIVGSPMTKADAESIVKQIKQGTIGTKGFMAYLSNGSSYGGGRRHTAEAIAGEAKIPMITINAEDFALKDIDALSQSADITEVKIKNIVSNAKTQAEANENKAAMIFIENFENFAPNPLVMGTSIYEKKAFSQLLTEMENARKNDNVNLIVVGSVNNQFCIDPNVMKPYKFLNSIIVYPPQDTNERKEVLDYYIKKMNLKIKGDTKEDKEKIVKEAAETTFGFTVVDLMYLLETVNNVSKERGKEAIDSSDFIEAYLEVVSGRVNKYHISDSRKRIVTSHEAGHALNLQIMYEIAEKQQIPWHLPDKVNFITLDPRGDFGGAMFHKSSDNQEYNFEKLMSDLVCSYGGHSAEKNIYNMSGSYGITADIEGVTATARAAVMDMGMGPLTGVSRIPRNRLNSPDVSEEKLRRIEKDTDSFVNAAKEISDSIIEAYRGFILEFTDRYASKVGTGDCIIPSETFSKELKEWRDKLPDDKKQELIELENKILEIMKKTKTGDEN